MAICIYESFTMHKYIYNQTSIQQSHWDKSAKTVLPVPVRNDNGT